MRESGGCVWDCAAVGLHFQGFFDTLLIVLVAFYFCFLFSIPIFMGMTKGGENEHELTRTRIKGARMVETGEGV